jgi:Protein involved in formate dehydrogenase formation
VNRPGSPSPEEIAAAFERRAARAEALAREAEAAGEPLRFAAGLNRVQARMAASLVAAHEDGPLSGRLGEDAGRVVERRDALLDFAARSGPEGLAEAARTRAGEDSAVAGSRLLVYWDGGRPATEDYLSRALLRPYVEVLRGLGIAPDRPHRSGYCPVCGGAPWIGVRRAESESDGARRYLGCGLCGGEWPFVRIRCPSCLEEDPYKLPSFRAEGHEAVRIEACETCRRYVKSIDLTDDARPIPEVDELLSLSMDLWAAEQGFTRIEPGLAGI